MYPSNAVNAQKQFYQSNPKRSKYGYGSARIAANNRLGDDIIQRMRIDGFEGLGKSAYANPKGYSIRYNPITGDKEMFIAGSKSMIDYHKGHLPTINPKGVGDWLSNAGEGLNALIIDVGHLNPEVAEWLERGEKMTGQKAQKGFWWRREAARRYDKIAEQEGVDIVYGHSRGAAVLSDMRFTGPKVGLDGALSLADHNDVWNIIAPQLFDQGIAYGGDNYTYTKEKVPFHFVYKKH